MREILLRALQIVLHGLIARTQAIGSHAQQSSLGDQ
ncbi:hypothetical protein GGD54_002447 [Rhizobium tropici]|uniref:Uncharacterized protein n=1 Tax=Rhizobium tropici TaxID=398 RepID=A0ABR6QYR7_RHITR|nr:hypothetical protein [Rhizobium tropici]MBB5593635.1 hypothetical protein [Rhizobium tropici]MBB6492043.1 hypothetical protein [Rhizobium tropici]